MTVETPPTKKGEKVRGMNASLSASSEAPPPSAGGPLSERDPGRLHITRRQIVAALMIAVLGVIGAIYTVNAVSSGSKTYPATVTASQVYDLNFANSGKVSDLMVKVGQRVTAGQALARQDATALQAQLAAAQGVVKADQAAVNQDAAPQLTPAQQQEDSLQTQQAQTAVTNAQAALASAESAGRANVAGAQAAAAAALSLVNTDNGRYRQACPAGPVPPSPTLTGSALQIAQSNYSQCIQLQQTLDKDNSSLTQAQAQVQVVQAQAQQAINNAQAAANTAQAQLNTTSYQPSLQTSATDISGEAQAQANLNQALQQLAQIQQEVKDATLVAPGAGIVTQVYGAVGEYLGPDGVHLYQAPPAVANNGSQGFNLFPSPSTQTGSGNTAGGNEPLIEVVGGQQQVMAQVPESQVSALPVGRKVTVSFSAVGGKVPGVVSSVVLEANRNSTSVTYDVIVTLQRTVQGLLPGMSATVN